MSSRHRVLVLLLLIERDPWTVDDDVSAKYGTMYLLAVAYFLKKGTRMM